MISISCVPINHAIIIKHSLFLGIQSKAVSNDTSECLKNSIILDKLQYLIHLDYILQIMLIVITKCGFYNRSKILIKETLFFKINYTKKFY